MSDERLKTKLVAFGYHEELVWTWDREELLNRFAEVILTGAQPKEPAVVDPELEKQRLAFEMKKMGTGGRVREAENADGG